MKLEAEIAKGIGLWNVQDALPWARRYPKRKAERPQGLVIHHSGKLGSGGLDGMIVSARFCIRKREWPGFAYTFWAPFSGELDHEGRLAIFRGNDDDRCTNHTKGFNHTHVALVLQGDLRKTGPSPSQIDILEGFLPWAADHYGWEWKRISEWLLWHSLVGEKKACPGAPTVAWLRAYRELA